MPQRPHATLRAAHALLLLLAAGSDARSQYVWSGAGPDENWLNLKNWSPQGIPNSGSTAFVAGGVQQPTLCAPAAVGSLPVTRGWLSVRGGSLGVTSSLSVGVGGGAIVVVDIGGRLGGAGSLVL